MKTCDGCMCELIMLPTKAESMEHINSNKDFTMIGEIDMI